MSRSIVPSRPSMAIGILSVALAGTTLACVAQSTGSGAPQPSVPAVTAPASRPGLTASAGPSASPAADAPPDATLAAEGGDPVVGQLGSFTWADGGSDSPWLPGAPLTVGAGEPLTVDLADGVAVATWTSRRVPAGTTDGAGAVGLGGGPPPATFAAPGPGSWSVQVDITFAGGLGAAVYYWLLTVR